MTKQYLVTYQAATAMRPEVVEADAVTIARGEGLLLFEPTWAEGRYHRPPPIPLRFLANVVDQESGQVLYDEPNPLGAPG